VKSVYFARPVGALGPIKIGMTRGPVERLRQLSVIEKRQIDFIHIMEGDGKLEHALFRCFADIHERGEWFKPHWRLIGFIEQLKSGVPVNEAIDLSDTRGHIFDYSNSAWKRPFARRAGKAVAA
jgi:hypothetical protein